MIRTGTGSCSPGWGSIILLFGDPGDPVVEFSLIKKPAGDVGPFMMDVGEDGGVSVEHGADLVDAVRRSGTAGLTAYDAAVLVFSKPHPSRAEVARARRKLEKLTRDRLFVRRAGAGTGPDGRPVPANWVLAASLAEMTEQDRARELGLPDRADPDDPLGLAGG